jgi:hypothetical protein
VIDGIVSGLGAAVILSLASWAYWSIALLPKIRHMRSFFGINNQIVSIGIYTGLLDVRPGGTQTKIPLRMGFRGPALVRSEYLAACAIRESLDTVGHFGRRVLRPTRIFRVPPCHVDAAPASVAAGASLLPHQSLILLGSSLNNCLTEKYFDSNSNTFFLYLRTDDGERNFRLRNDQHRALPSRRPPHADEDRAWIVTTQAAVIERHFDRENGRYVICIMGVGALATAGAGRHLAKYWEDYYRRISLGQLAEEFGVYLAFNNCPPDLSIEKDLSDIPDAHTILFVDKNHIDEPYANPENPTMANENRRQRGPFISSH